MRFDPPTLDMGPVLPYTPQGDSREVMVTNDGAFDVEIFSLDFDKVGRIRVRSHAPATKHQLASLPPPVAAPVCEKQNSKPYFCFA